MKSKQPDLSIVIPALGEEKRIGKTLDELAAFLAADELMRSLAVELLVVAADAGDRTQEIVESKLKLFSRATLLCPGSKVGKGRDVRYGMLRATGQAVIFMDADLATPLRYLPIFYRAYRDGADVVVGTRNLRKHHKNVLRLAIANAGNLIFRFAGGIWIEDSQCGFKMFSAHAAQICFSHLTIQQWGFDMEILAIAKVYKFKIATFRVDDWRHMPYSTFEGAVLKNSLQSLRDLLHIARRRYSGTYLQNNNIDEV